MYHEVPTRRACPELPNGSNGEEASVLRTMTSERGGPSGKMVEGRCTRVSHRCVQENQVDGGGLGWHSAFGGWGEGGVEEGVKWNSHS